MEKIEMLESYAYKALSLCARRVLDRLEIEFERHKRAPLENGNLPCTYEDFVEYGITRRLVRPAINEVVALGFVRETRKGSAGNADQREATLFMLTYRHSGSNAVIEDGWRRIQSKAEAELIAKAARNRKGDARAREFGRKGAGRSLGQKQSSSDTKCTEISDTKCTKDGSKSRAKAAVPSYTKCTTI